MIMVKNNWMCSKVLSKHEIEFVQTYLNTFKIFFKCRGRKYENSAHSVIYVGVNDFVAFSEN